MILAPFMLAVLAKSSAIMAFTSLSRSFHGFSLPITIPYELPEPLIILRPTTVNENLISGMLRAMLSICLITMAVCSCEVAGGKVISDMMVPRSSFGTKPFGVVFMAHIKATVNKTIPKPAIHFLRARNPTDLLYLVVMASNDALNAA
ncbi:hypothetical protein D3C87_1375520 [compost metagenome]